MKEVCKRLAITTLSPIHIGCGEVFEPSQFVIIDKVLHLLDPEAILLALKESELRQLIKLTKKTDPIGPLQWFFYGRREQLASLADHLVDVAPDIAKEYEEKIGRAQQHSMDGEPVYNLFQMVRTAYNALDGAAYLPGSSLKGAMRTAWLSKLNEGATPSEAERKKPRMLEARLLGYKAGRFQDDPFRCIKVADAHHNPDDLPPATRILYAVSKKKRESQHKPSELKVFLEAVREAQSNAFLGELRLSSNTISWEELCRACNDFYWPKFEGELIHEYLGPMLDKQWRKLMLNLLDDEFRALREANQGFLLRIGRHSGAESLTLDGASQIKILGARGQPPTYRTETTEKRFASQTRTAQNGLLPFGWLWVDAADDAHQHLAIKATEALRRFAGPMRQAHRERIETAKDRRQARAQEAALRDQNRAEAAAAQAEAEAKEAARIAQRAMMSENERRIKDFEDFCAKRFEQLRGSKEKPHAQIYQEALNLAKTARESANWTAEEKCAAADAIEEWLPKLVSIDIKDVRKKLLLNDLRG